MIYSLIKDLIPCPTYLKKREDGDFLIVSSKDLNIYYLNETGKDFYMLMDGRKTVEQIVAELVNIYDVEKEILEDDILKLIRDLQWKGVLIFKEGNYSEVIPQAANN